MGSIKFDEQMARTLFWIILGCTVAMAIFIIAPFVNALLWAAVLSVLFHPLYKKFRRKMNEGWSAGLVTLICGSAIVLPLIGVGTAAGIQVYQIGSKLVEAHSENGGKITLEVLGEEVDKMIKPVISTAGIQSVKDFSVKDWLGDNREVVTKSLPVMAQSGAEKLGTAAMTLIFAVMTMFFMLKDGPKLLPGVYALIPLPRDETESILEKMKATLQSVFTGIVFVALVQAVLATILYICVGAQGALILGLLTFLCALIPLIGAPAVYVPLAVYQLATGHIWQGVVVLCVGFGLVSTIDNAIRPFVIGAKTNLHPMAVFFSLLGGVLLMGPIGLMAGPVVLTVLLGLVDIIATRRKLVEEAEAPENPECPTSDSMSPAT